MKIGGRSDKRDSVDGRRERSETGRGREYSHVLYDSIEAVPADQWESLRWGDHDLLMDRRFLRAVERSKEDRARPWYVLFHDSDQVPVGSACLSLYRADARWMVRGRIGAALDRVIGFAPWRLQLRLLFCGLPIPTWESCLRIAPMADSMALVKILDELLTRLAAEHRASCVVIKYLHEEECRRLDGLLDLGYLLAGGLPVYHTRSTHQDFEDYCGHVRSHRRQRIRYSQRKFERSSLRVVEVRGRDAADHLGADEIYPLYEAVFDRSKVKLEKVSPPFIRELASELPDGTILLLVYDRERIVGFSVSLVIGGVYRCMFLGLDYQWNLGCDLYFNLLYRVMDRAYRMNVSDIVLGSTADAFKQGRLGCDSRRSFFYLKGTRPVSSWFIRRHFGRFRPALDEPAGISGVAARGSTASERIGGAGSRLVTVQ